MIVVWRIFLAVLLFLGVAGAASENTFVFMLNEEPDPLEPTQIYDSEGAYLVENMYETLIGFGQTGEIIPELATSWEVSDDGLVYTFTLREGVTFHTGNPMRCEDAAYSLHRSLVTNDGSSNAYMLSELTLGFGYWDDDEGLIESTPFSAITDAVACNEQGQLVLTLLEPSSSLFERLTNFYILDQTFAVEQGEWSGTEEDWQDWIMTYVGDSALSEVSAGTNAYQLVSIDPSRAVFKAFENYWGGKPAIENVIVQIVPDENTRTLAIKNGDADAAEVGAELVKQIEGTADVSLLTQPGKRVYTLVFNQAIALEGLGSGTLDGKGIPADFFSDVHVRRGFVAAFDSERLISEALNGQAQQLSLSVPSLFGGVNSNVKPIPYDLALAETELKEAWDGAVWENGFTLDVWFDPNQNQNQVLGEKAAEVLKLGLESLNPKFRVNLLPYTGDEYFELALDAAQAPMFVDSFVGDWFAQDYYMDTVNHTELGFYSPIGWDGEVEPFSAINTALDSARTELDSEARSLLYQQVGQLIADNALYILIPEPTYTLAYRNEVKNFAESYNGYHYGFLQWQQLSK